MIDRENNFAHRDRLVRVGDLGASHIFSLAVGKRSTGAFARSRRRFKRGAHISQADPGANLVFDSVVGDGNRDVLGGGHDGQPLFALRFLLISPVSARQVESVSVSIYFRDQL